ncbi:MAG: urate hydroxylase PuuD [Candidatus Pacebacteria bacterium]|nr:urate hydroxylase PuuD [Candidatus Paceibacterota bacterium]
MKNPLENLHLTLILGLVVMVILAFALRGESSNWMELLRVAHIWFGVLWIGLLYYFNFVQIPSMKKIPDEQKPAVSKFIAPLALFFFRWAAMATVIIGLIIAWDKGYLHESMSFQPGFRAIGVGMWLGIIMWFNVWFVIWPNQKRALGLVEATADIKKASARRAMLFSRTNALLSFPMLYCMVAQGHIGTN